MNEPSAPASDSSNPDAREQVVELLAEYLRACRKIDWPGTDGLTTQEVVSAFYLVVSASGHVPSPAELVRLHPEIADGIAAFLTKCGPLDGTHIES